MIDIVDKIEFPKDHKGLMYGFVTHKPNPLGGDCYRCNYCYIHGVKGMKNRFKHIKEKYSGKFRLYDDVLSNRYEKGDVVFFCDCIDYLHEDNPDENVRAIYEWVDRSPYAIFLSLTKNPIRYFDFQYEIPNNIILGCTIESDIEHNYSNAPNVFERLSAMCDLANSISLNHYPRMVSIEPILKFTYYISFGFQIEMTIPRIIAVGYDNHKCKLNEPSLAITEMLIKHFENIKYNESPKPIIVKKTLRKAWWEK